MLTIREIEHHFDYLSEDSLNTLLELRNLVDRIAPDATEVIHRYGITYYHADRGGPVSAGICQIVIREEHIELAFIHGAFLPDPTGILRGDRKAKRFVRIDSYDLAPWPELERLIEAHNRFDPYTQTFLPITGKQPMR
jgi:hypothetical protein